MNRRRKNVLIIGIVGIGLVIAISVIGAIYIHLAPVFTLVLYAGLIAVTILYAYFSMETAEAARQQADASMKMAEEMREQRYDAVRPVIDIERRSEAEEQIGEAMAAKEEDFSYGLWCILRNIGAGPATDVYSFIINPLYNKRQLWPFDTLAIKEETQKKRFSIEQKGDRKVLVVYYRDVHNRCFESSREVISVDKERGAWNIGALDTREIPKEEFP